MTLIVIQYTLLWQILKKMYLPPTVTLMIVYVKIKIN